MLVFQHCGGKSHPDFKYWRGSNAKCCKCNQIGEGIIYKNKDQQGEAAKVVDEKEEDQLFVATCFSGIKSSDCWLIDSHCINRMMHEKDLFRELRSTSTSKVRMGNDEYVPVEGKGTVTL